jgi:hypothetical protein
MIGGQAKRRCSRRDAERFKSDTSGRVPRVLQLPIGAANGVPGTLRLEL